MRWGVETPKRTLVKSALWSAMGCAVMAVVGFVATGSFAAGGAMAIVNTAIGLLMYVLYERAWARVSWGRI